MIDWIRKFFHQRYGPRNGQRVRCYMTPGPRFFVSEVTHVVNGHGKTVMLYVDYHGCDLNLEDLFKVEEIS